MTSFYKKLTYVQLFYCILINCDTDIYFNKIQSITSVYSKNLSLTLFTEGTIFELINLLNYIFSNELG